MANRWKGNFVVATEATSSGTAYTGKANGSWSLNNQIQQKQANLWAKGVTAPTAPTIGTATAGNANASVAFTGSSDAGAPGSLTYTATSIPGSFTNTGSLSPIVVSGLTNGTQYTFTVKATNSLGLTSADSTVSNSTGLTAPSSPTSVTATAGAGTAIVSFTASSSTGGLPISAYTATSNPGNVTSSASSSPITVTGLTNGTSYTFTVTATNGGSLTSSASSPSNSVTPNNLTLIALSNWSVSPYITVVNYASGSITAKYSNPSTTPIGNSCANTAFNNDATTIALASNPITVYPWSNGFGTAYSNPTVTTYGSEDVTFTPDGSIILLAGYNVPYLHAYSWSNATGFGTKFANPSTSVGSVPGAVKFNSSGNTLFIPSDSTPFAHAYAFSASGFGSKFANPATLPPGEGTQDGYSGKQISLRHTDDVIAFPSNASPWLNVYAWNNGFGTKYTAPSDLTGQQARGMAFSSSGNTLVAGLRYTPFVAAYAWTNAGGFGTRKASPSPALTSDARGVAFTANNSAIAISYSSPSPFYNMYQWSDAGFGNQIATSSYPLGDAGFGITIYN